jgi:TonB family protein
MVKKERFGKFVLLDEIDTSGLGSEHRAAKLGPAGLEKIVSVLRVKAALSANADAAKTLMDQVKVAAQLQNPNVVKILGIGKVETAYYISYEFLEGKSLKAIFARCRQDGFPFSVDHALLIASKICTALEYAHARKAEGGVRYFHGLVNPGNVLVSYEGEVRLRGFGYWPAKVREAGGVSEDEALYLAPEQAAGGIGDTRSDTFAVGAILYETLTGRPLFQEGRTDDVAGRLAAARLQNPTTDDDALPKPIADILNRSVAGDPAKRYVEIQEMRKAVDTLLFSGDFTPTTFNLAFFMHSLFREDIEKESRALKEEKESSYLEYIAEEPRAAAKTGPTGFTLPGMPAVTAAGVAAAAAAEPAELRDMATQITHRDAHEGPLAREAAAGHVRREATAAVTPTPAPPVVHHREHHPSRESHPPTGPLVSGDGGGSARDAGAGLTFHKDEAKKSKLPVFAGLAVLLLVAAGATWFIVARRARLAAEASPVPTTLSAEAIQLRELQAKLAALEAEKAAAVALAEEEARKKMEAEAAAKGRAIDAAALQKAQEEARRKAEAEQVRKQEEEKRRLEAEQRAAAERLAEEQRLAAEEAARQAAATTTVPAVTQPPAPAVKPGQLVDINEPGVIAPVALTKGSLQYPPIALRQRVDGTVEVSALVDEKGNVTDARVTSQAGGKAGLNEAAVDYVKRWRFRAATKEGVPVKVWAPISVKFVLPR